MNWGREMSLDKTDYDRLIARRLDGAITDEESLLLDRALLRDPALRRTLEVYERIDALSAVALSNATGPHAPSVDLNAITGQRTALRLRRPHRGWFLLIPGAVAAALLALVVPMPHVTSQDRPVAVEHRPVTPTMMGRPTSALPLQNGLLRNVNTTRRSTGRQVIGVIGEDGNVYWIEVDRTRTIKVPPHTGPTSYQPL